MKSILQFIFGITGVIDFFILFGIVGGYQSDKITTLQAIVSSMICFAYIGILYLGFLILDIKSKKPHKDGHPSKAVK